MEKGGRPLRICSVNRQTEGQDIQVCPEALDAFPGTDCGDWSSGDLENFHVYSLLRDW